MKMDVSIIIINYRSPQMVIECVESVLKKTEGITYEIIIIDNGSGDNSETILKRQLGDSITLVEAGENLGFGKANNLGVDYAKGEYIFLLNPDTLLVNNAIKILHDYIKVNRKVGIVGGNLFSPDMKATPSYCMEFDDLNTERRKASWRAILGGKIIQKVMGERNDKLFRNEFNYSEKTKKVAYIFGADMMLSKKLFENVGGFDKEFFMYAEEQELSWRITKQGYDIVSVPQAQIIHLEGATVKQQNEFSERQFRMRMNGTLTYFKKRFGINGAKEFYQLRSKRYKKLIQIAKWQGKDIHDFGPAIQQQCLKEVFRDFIGKN